MKTILRNALIAAILLLIPAPNFAQAPPLGVAAGFVLFTTVGAVGIDGISQITGNVGTNSGGVTISVNVNGVIGASAQCAADLLTAYAFLNSAIPNFFPAPLLGNGQILIAGVYSISGAATMNGNLILDAQGNANAVFIIKIQGSFSANANSKVKLLNGAMACNVFWKVEGLVSLAAGTAMRGTIIANNAAINILTGDTLEGRALSTNGAVNFHGVMAYTPVGCGSPVLTGPAAPALASTACYAIFSSNGPVSNAGITYVTGDVGTNVGLTTGFNPLFVTGTIHPIPDASTAQCAADLGNVYTYLNTLPNDIQLMYPAQFGHNLVLTPHTYLMLAATTFTDTLYLNAMGNANAVFVIKINGALSTSTYSRVNLINGALAKNVFWKVDGAVSINDYSVFKGTIVCNNGAILLSTGVALEGRALTTTGALGTTAITAAMPPGCGGTSSPTITSQPTNQTSCVGGSASFSVTATGTGLTYQWRKGIVNLINGGNISGATSATLTINPVSLSDAAPNYNVVVSGTFLPNVTSNNVSLTVNPAPLPTITGPASVCVNSLGNVYSTQPSMTNYTWTVSLGGSITAGGGVNNNTVTVTWNATGAQLVSVNYFNSSNCTAAAPTVYPVTVNPLPIPTLMGLSSVCVNDLNDVYTTDVGMAGYIWTVSAGGSISSGQGTNQIHMVWNTPGAQSVTINYTNLNGCTALVPTLMNVTVYQLPGNAGDIIGAPENCAGTQGVPYTTTPINDVETYIWELPAGATIASGTGTPSITVNFNTNASSGNISVYGNNPCGNGNPSSLAVTVTPLPETAGPITGEAAVCQGTTGVIYSVASIANAITYNWSVPTGATIVSGAGTNTIIVDFGMDATTGEITVYGSNLCGDGISSDFDVTVSLIPATPVVTAAGDLLSSSAPNGNQWYFEGAIIPGATDQTYLATLSGWYWTIVTLYDCSSDASNQIDIFVTGQQELSVGTINIYPVPNDGRFTVSIGSLSKDSFTITVFTNLGVQIREVKDIHVNGRFDQVIDLSTAVNGIYTVVIRNSNDHIVKRVVLNR